MATWWPRAVFGAAGDGAGADAPPMRVGEMVIRSSRVTRPYYSVVTLPQPERISAVLRVGAIG